MCLSLSKSLCFSPFCRRLHSFLFLAKRYKEYLISHRVINTIDINEFYAFSSDTRTISINALGEELLRLVSSEKQARLRSRGIPTKPILQDWQDGAHNLKRSCFLVLLGPYVFVFILDNILGTVKGQVTSFPEQTLCPSSMNDYGIAVEWYWQSRAEGFGDVPIPLPHCLK